MKNIKSIIDSHNKKLLHEEKRVEPIKACNCQRSRRERCPMKGKCVQKDVIYHAEVKGGGEVRKYVGSTVNFKRRHSGCDLMWLSVGTICLDLVAPNLSKVVQNFSNTKNVYMQRVKYC